MATTHTIDGSIADWVPGVDPRRVRAVAFLNIPATEVVVEDSGKVWTASKAVNIDTALGTFAAELLATDATDLNVEPDTLRWTIQLSVVDQQTRLVGRTPQADRRTVTLGPFPVTADASIGDLAAHFDSPAISPQWRSAYKAEVEQAAQAALASTVAAKDAAEAASAAAEADRTAVATDRAYVENLVITDLGTTDGQTKALIESPTSETAGALSAAIGGAQAGASFAPCPHIETSDTAGTSASKPKPLDAFNGYVYATHGATLYRATTPQGPWTSVHDFSTGTGALSAVRETGDGEVIVAQGSYGIWCSTGWAANPLTASWARVLTTNAPVASFGLTVDTDLGWIAATTYISGASMVNSRYVWLSKDHGQTWAVIYDKTVQHPEVAAATSHFHCIGFDRYHNASNPRVWMSWHKTSDDPTFNSDPKNFICYTDNAGPGATWIDYSTDDMHPLFFAATPAGIVHDTDSINYGSSLMLIDRATMQTRRIFRRRTLADETNLWSWASRAIAGTDPGTWHILWRSTKANTPAGVTTTDGERTVETVTINPATGTDIVDAADLMLHKGKMIGVTRQTVSSGAWEWWQVREPRRGAPPAPLGNIEGGAAFDQSVAAGLGAKTTGLSPWKAVVVGQQAEAQREGVAVGFKAATTNFQAVAVGREAAAGQNSVAVGHQAISTGSNVVLVGHGASGASRGTVVGQGAATISTDATAIGHLASAGLRSTVVGKSAIANTTDVTMVGQGTTSSGSGVVVGSGASVIGAGGTALGQAATATASAVAVGQAATATHSASVALGAGTATTGSAQVAVGAKHVEYTKVASEPSGAAADKARVYVRDNGAGKQQLVIRFGATAVQVIATEA